MQFKELTDYCQALAIASKLDPTEESVWRSICRSYARKFNESLSDCIDGKVDPVQILLNVYEDQLEGVDEDESIERLMDIIYSIEDPEYERAKETDLEEFIEDAELQEAERIKAGKPIHKALLNDNILGDTTLPGDQPEPDRPTGGSIDLSHLENEELDS